ncbi:hypothetical protein EV144_106259 [Flavobacterium sp. 270]|uniref:hypothetical protein n=1 Tax=Flavobacterium sp. 270 TaxID=2512114 RepID=UPI00106544AF|nr:hypothetical protein [Flavobacterium sp. 270]TDW46587.1 hypothetical protein EV144_106259 [Flavobacterium sp. 270]
MRCLLIVAFLCVIVSCENKKTNNDKIHPEKIQDTKKGKKIKELDNQVFHLVLYENEYSYFLGKKGDFQDVTLNFNVNHLVNEATIDNIFYSNEFNSYQNQLYRIKDHIVKNDSNYEISVFDEGEDKDAKINFLLINKKDDVWKFEFRPSWKEEDSKRDYLENLDLRDEYRFINKRNIDSIVVLTKGLWSERDDNEENMDTVCYPKPYYFKLKEKYKHWKNYNPIRFVSSKSKINIYEEPNETSKVVATLKYNDWIIVNDTLKKQQNSSEGWLDIFDKVHYEKGYILNKNLAEKPTYNFPVK